MGKIISIPILFSNLSFLCFGMFLFMGIYVFLKDKKSSLNRTFLIFSVVLAVWAFAYSFVYVETNEKALWLWYKLSAFGWATFSSPFLHFLIILTGKQKRFKNPWIYVLLYGMPVAFVLRLFTGTFITEGFYYSAFGNIEIQGPNSTWSSLFMTYWLTCCFFALYLIWDWREKASTKRERKQANIIFYSAIIPLTGGLITNRFLPIFGVQFPAIAQILSIIWIFGIWHAINKYKLMELTPEIAVDEIISKIRDLLVLVNPSGKILKVNNQLLNILGYKENELVGESADILFKYYEVASNEEAYNKKPISHSKDINTYFNAKDGTGIRVSLSTEEIFDIEGDFIGIIMVAQDIRIIDHLKREISERKQAEEELIKSNGKLKELDKMKTDFLSTVSHELRTPLTSILGFAKIIGKKYKSFVMPALSYEDKKLLKVSNQIIGNIDVIISEGERLTHMIDDVLDVARMDEGKTMWDLKEISPEKIIESAIKSTYSLFYDKNIEIKKNIEKNLPKVQGDEDKLMQVVINLISNAVKFTDSGCVICEVKHGNNEVIFSVIDTGIGIEEKYHDKIFEKFTQVGDTLTNKPKGAGLGLSICKNIVEYHGGSIWVESEKHKGSKFYFSIPMRQI